VLSLYSRISGPSAVCVLKLRDRCLCSFVPLLALVDSFPDNGLKDTKRLKEISWLKYSMQNWAEYVVKILFCPIVVIHYLWSHIKSLNVCSIYVFTDGPSLRLMPTYGVVGYSAYVNNV